MSSKVTFLPAGLEVEAKNGETLFEVGRRNAVAIETSCVGRATCGLCRIKIVQGQHLLSPISEAETKHLGNVYFLTKIRLSCEAVIQDNGDIVVELAPKRARKNK